MSLHHRPPPPPPPLLAEDTAAHLCDHPRTAFGTQGCPSWPACLAPGTGIMRPAAPAVFAPITDDEAVAFAERWREAMAAGRIAHPLRFLPPSAIYGPPPPAPTFAERILSPIRRARAILLRRPR
jgi:hypothetical protein